ncbi:MAG: serine/threonine protein kinase [Planctomycetales bacterium]|nr:serine/threonine protein kinase [Planctomycetales bacterium]
MNQISHPESEQLLHYLQGVLSLAEEREVDGHVEFCETCCRSLEELCQDELEHRIRKIHSTSTIGIAADATINGISKPQPKNGSGGTLLVDNGGRYQFESEVARGGMGVIYSGHDQLLDRDLVLKVLHPNVGESPEAARRFIAEAKIGGNLQHPGIVPIHDIGTPADNRPFFSMRRIEGDSFDELLGRRSNPADDQSRLLNILTQVAQTIAYAHSQNIIHRDIKPKNIMVGRFGEVQVVDWGIAKHLDSHDSRDSACCNSMSSTENAECDAHATGDGLILGTPAYMAPEQATGDKLQIGKQTDVFALGAILYELLTGTRVYSSDDSDMKSSVERAAKCDLADAFNYIDTFNLDHELVTFCKQCLSPNPLDRPADASCVATALIDHGESSSQRLRQAEITAETQRAVYNEKSKRRLVTLAATVVVAGLCTVLSISYAHHYKTQALLSEAIAEERDTYQRSAELSSIYASDVRAELLQAFDRIPASSRREISRNTNGRLSAFDVEFSRQLLDAHIWLAAGIRGSLQQQCRNEAKRKIATAFTVYPGWRSAESTTATQAADWLAAKDPWLRAVVINALDEYLLIAWQNDNAWSTDEDFLSPETVFTIADRADADTNRKSIRQFIRAKDAESLLSMESDFDAESHPPATAYFLAVGLQIVGEIEAAEQVLSSARAIHGEDFWLVGHVLDNDSNMPPADLILMSVKQSVGQMSAVDLLLGARRYTRERRYKLALEQFQLLFRHEQLTDDLITSSRLNAAIQFWKELGQFDPAAIEALQELQWQVRVQVVSRDESDRKREQSFQMFAAINRSLGASQETADLFLQLDAESDSICPRLFPVIAPELTRFHPSATTKYSDRRFSHVLKKVAPSPAMGTERQQFATVLTLIAMQVRTGHSPEAIDIANDARLLWPDKETVAEIDAALKGELPGEASQK